MDNCYFAPPYPAALLPDPVDHIFPEVVHGPADYCPDDTRNLGHKSLNECGGEEVLDFKSSLTSFVSLYSGMQSTVVESRFTHFDDESTGKVEQSDHPAPGEFAVRKDLAGHIHKSVLCGTE